MLIIYKKLPFPFPLFLSVVVISIFLLNCLYMHLDHFILPFCLVVFCLMHYYILQFNSVFLSVCPSFHMSVCMYVYIQIIWLHFVDILSVWICQFVYEFGFQSSWTFLLNQFLIFSSGCSSLKKGGKYIFMYILRNKIKICLCFWGVIKQF